LTVSVEVPVAFGSDAALKAQVGAGVAAPVTLQARVTVPVNPPVGAIVIVDVADAPALTVAGVSAEGVMVNPAEAAAVTVRLTVVECVTAPEVPVIVKLEIAIGVAAVVAIVSVDVPVVSEAGLNAQVAPAGKPVQVRATVPVNPFVGDTFMVEVPDWPGPATVTGVPPTEKLGVATNVGHDVTSTLASTVPSPVTRS
jgi:hypothetical protein